jgi:hypothetical protein
LIGHPLLQASLIQTMIKLLRAWIVRKIAASSSVSVLVSGVENYALLRMMTLRIGAISVLRVECEMQNNSLRNLYRKARLYCLYDLKLERKVRACAYSEGILFHVWIGVVHITLMNTF